MITLDRAIEIAAKAHAGQKDKGGASYIRHPLRVMFGVEEAGGTEDEMIVAVLHDVVEDCDVSLDQLAREGLTETQVAALDALTKRDGESYEEAVQRALVNPIARRVKIADLEDNLKLHRIKNRRSLEQKDLERINRYLAAWTLLTGR